jgi:predicted ferric reductase
MNRKSVLVAALIYLAWPLYQSVDYALAQPFAEIPDIVNYAASIFSYNWLLLNVILALKLPYFQRILPYDFRIRLHVLSSALIAAFILYHGIFYGIVKAKMLTWVIWALIAGLALILALGALWIPVPFFKRIREKVLAALPVPVLRSYDALKYAHKALYVALAGLVFLHILDAELIGVASPASSFGFQGLFWLTVALYLFTLARNRVLPALTVVVAETAGGITRLTLTASPRLRYKSGQFAFLRFRKPGLRYEEHPFSFTSAEGDSVVSFAIRNLGDFSAKLASVEPGEKVRVNGGFGGFWPRKSGKPLALIGSGIGEAPIISILKDIAKNQQDRPVVCVIAVTTRDELVDYEELQEIAKAMPSLKLTFLVAAEGDPLFSEDLFRREFGDASRYEFYLCSSDKVRKITLKILDALKVPRSLIHFEAFSFG